MRIFLLNIRISPLPALISSITINKHIYIYIYIEIDS